MFDQDEIELAREDALSLFGDKKAIVCNHTSCPRKTPCVFLQREIERHNTLHISKYKSKDCPLNTWEVLQRLEQTDTTVW